ncbi:hypothetical protein [Amycolatopsis sp. cmx-4-54]|uniref:hypothetical protein n=1 Tax=Amycolatopsis sp. cmx-4-54 TaxID=2790936 RepID=UPI00397AAE8D
MTLPSWRDTSRGTMVRGALWLESEVGEGEIFTKTRLREAFPDVSQIDRRLRDLRDYGWQIDTRREDPSLKQEEQRYVKRGREVWIPGQAKVSRNAGLTAAQRSKIMLADNFLCRSCGIAGGDLYGEDGVTSAQLDVARRKVQLPDGTAEVQLVTECNRCRVGRRGHQVDLPNVLAVVESLAPLERQIFAKWIEADGRKLSGLEKLWGIYRTLPEESRQLVRQATTEDGH